MSALSNHRNTHNSEVLCMTLAIAQRWQIILLSFITSLLTSYATGQQTSATQAADELFAQSKWEQAAQAYAQITVKEPANGLAWQNLGECYLRLSGFNHNTVHLRISNAEATSRAGRGSV